MADSYSLIKLSKVSRNSSAVGTNNAAMIPLASTQVSRARLILLLIKALFSSSVSIAPLLPCLCFHKMASLSVHPIRHMCKSSG